VFSSVQMTSLHHERGRCPSSLPQRWSPYGSGGGHPMPGSLANSVNQGSITPAGQFGRSFWMSATVTISSSAISNVCVRARYCRHVDDTTVVAVAKGWPLRLAQAVGGGSF